VENQIIWLQSLTGDDKCTLHHDTKTANKGYKLDKVLYFCAPILEKISVNECDIPLFVFFVVQHDLFPNVYYNCSLLTSFLTESPNKITSLLSQRTNPEKKSVVPTESPGKSSPEYTRANLYRGSVM